MKIRLLLLTCVIFICNSIKSYDFAEMFDNVLTVNWTNQEDLSALRRANGYPSNIKIIGNIPCGSLQETLGQGSLTSLDLSEATIYSGTNALTTFDLSWLYNDMGEDGSAFRVGKLLLPNNTNTLDGYISSIESLTDIYTNSTTPFRVSQCHRADFFHVPEGSREAWVNSNLVGGSVKIVEHEVGDTFTSTTEEGVTMTFTVLNNMDMTCCVGTYSSSSNSISTTTEGKVTIPSVAKGYQVVIIGKGAFSDCQKMTEVIIPNSIKTIACAFARCSGLTSITIPSSVNRIEKQAFWGCTGIKEVVIENGLTSITLDSNKYSDGIGGGLFEDCPIETAYFGRNIELVLPNSAPWFASPFYTYFANFDRTTSGSIVSKITFGSNVTSLFKYLLHACKAVNTLTSLATTPPTVDSYALYGMDYENCVLYVPAGTKSLYAAATGWKDFTNIVEMAPTTPTITFADINVKALCVQNWDTDGDCELSMDEAAAVTNLGTVFKMNTTITSFDELQYFTGLTSIGDYAFEYCFALTSVIIPNSVTYISNYAFEGCDRLSSVTVERETPPNVGFNIFSNCSNATLYVPTGCKGAYLKADRWNEFKLIWDVQDPIQTLDYISPSATVVIPSNYNVISGTDKIDITSTEDDYYEDHYHYNIFLKNTYFFDYWDESSCADNYWSGNDEHHYSRDNTVKTILFPSNSTITDIIHHAFSGCKNLRSVTFPESLLVVGESAFRYCSSLTSITIPNSVIRIGDYAFSDCSGLKSVTIGSSVTSISSSAFYGCSGLTAVKVESESPLSIGSYTFTNRANTTLYIPKGCKSAYQAANYWKEFKAIKEFPDSDVNQDGEIDMMDVVDIARYVVGTPAETFVEFLADLNNNGEVNVADAVVLVNEIVGDQNFAKAFGAQRQDQGDDRLTLTKNNGLHSLPIRPLYQ